MTVEAGYHPLPMGQRANLIVRTTERDELYYSHWRANTLDSDLFWGPEAATAFARAQRSVAEGAEWLDEIWVSATAPPALASLLEKRLTASSSPSRSQV